MVRNAAGRLGAMGLGAVAGYADATGYLHWHTFGANMTGNTVLFAIALFEHAPDALRLLVPIAVFFGGSMIAGALLLAFPAAVPLVLEAIVLIIAAFSRGFVLQMGFLALAMGLQNTAISRFDGVRANTSFITGDYSRVAAALANIVLGRSSRDDPRTLSVVAPLILSYAAGAFVAASCARFTDLSLLFIVPVVLALAYAAWRGTLA